ncbi:TPA: DUF637 domain-containing protein [Providencia rettgeri]|nr:DUF637 domain-containing protein [Providencia rettgeri]
MLNDPSPLPSRPKRIVSYSIVFLTAVSPLHPAWGAVTTAADKNTQISQQNNIPVINIATPNGAGISHNKFQHFNVDRQGAVLNNATTNVNSQIAGQIKANANLKGNAANLIINEVTGSSRSELQGKLEVAGKQANVLIANPNGITCDGCSFINTPAITLTTGKPIIDKTGALSAVEVKKGSVIIGANGLNADAQTYADIISRATELNGQINAKNLTLMQGTNRVDFQKGTVTAIAGEGAKPSISVDTKALGGMYANQVKLISTESGVGINLSNVQTNQSDLTLTVDGKITLAGNIQAKKDLNVSTKTLHINADANVKTLKDITLATNTFTNQGQVIATNDLRLFGDNISNTGEKAVIQANKSMWIQKNAKGDLSTRIINQSGTIKTNTGDLVIRTKQLDNQREVFALSNEQNLAANSANITVEGKPYDARVTNSAGAAYLRNMFKNVAAKDIPTTWFGDIYDYEIGQSKIKSFNTLRRDIAVTKTSAIGLITSGKNAYINANVLNNIQSNLNAKNNLILTGNQFTNPIASTGIERTMTIFTALRASDPTYEKTQEIVIDNGIDYAGKLTAGNSLVLDFKDKVQIENPSSTLPAKTTAHIYNPVNDILLARHVLVNSANIRLSGGIKATNSLSLVAQNALDLTRFRATAPNTLSLTAINNITVKESLLSSANIDILSRTGNILVTTPEYKDAFVNRTQKYAQINATNALTVFAGNNLTFDNTVIGKANHIALNANKDITLGRAEEKQLTRTAANVPVYERNLLNKIGVWESAGDLNITAGGSVNGQGNTFISGKDLNIAAGKDLVLSPKSISDVDKILTFGIDRLPETRAQLTANGNITLNAGRDVNLQSTQLQSKGNVTALSGRDINLLATAYSALANPNEDNQDVRYTTTLISGDKGVSLAANGAITAQGGTLTSLGDITLSSGGNMRLESVKTHYRKQEGKRLEDVYRQVVTDINSGKNLTILSQGSVLFQASRLVAKGTMDIAAKGGYLYAQAMEELNYYEEESKKCNKWTLCITKKEVKKTRSETTNKVTEFTAGGDINLYAKDDVTLEASKVNAGKNAKITSQKGKVNFKAVKNTTFEQVVSNSKGFYISQRNKGYKEDTWILPALYIGGKLTIDAAQGITADIKAKNNQSLQNALNSLGQAEGTKWLAGLKDNKDVQWNLVKDAYDSWDYKSQSLNPVASALIMITVAAMTSGTATTFAAWAASGTSGTTAAVISGAAYSGMTALSTQAAVALAENQGNLSKTLKALGQSDTVKSIITQMVISGALNGLDVEMEWTTGNPGGAKLPLLANNDWNKVAQRVAAQSVISSTVNTAAFGGSFTDNFKNALLSNIGSQINAEGAKLIGDNGDILDHSGKLLAHSVVSGISAEIAGGSAKGAIVGALAAQLAGISLNNNLIEEKDWEKSLEFDAQVNKLLGGIAGAIFVGNENGVYSGANSAEIVTKFNHQQHLQFVLGEGGVRYFQGISSLGEQMSSEGYSPEEISAAFTVYIKRNLPEGQDPAKGFILAWARLVGPYGLAAELIMDNNPLTLDSAESIISLGKLTSKKQIAQFIIAQTYFNVVKPLSLGSTGRTEAYTLKEQVAMQHAISNSKKGIEIPVVMTDKRWPSTEGWVKMSQNINGIEIHYVRNKKTGAVDDFKFK